MGERIMGCCGSSEATPEESAADLLIASWKQVSCNDPVAIPKAMGVCEEDIENMKAIASLVRHHVSRNGNTYTLRIENPEGMPDESVPFVLGKEFKAPDGSCKIKLYMYNENVLVETRNFTDGKPDLKVYRHLPPASEKRMKVEMEMGSSRSEAV